LQSHIVLICPFLNKVKGVLFVFLVLTATCTAMTPYLLITAKGFSTALTPVHFGNPLYILGKRLQTWITADNTTNRQIPINKYKTKPI